MKSVTRESVSHSSAFNKNSYMEDSGELKKVLSEFNQTYYSPLLISKQVLESLLALYKLCDDFTTWDSVGGTQDSLMAFLPYKIFPGHQAHEDDYLEETIECENGKFKLKDEAKINFQQTADSIFDIRRLVVFIGDIYSAIEKIESFSQRRLIEIYENGLD